MYYNIMIVEQDNHFIHRKFFIDCPIDVEMFGSEIRRIEIPRELAYYIKKLQDENERLKDNQ